MEGHTNGGRGNIGMKVEGEKPLAIIWAKAFPRLRELAKGQREL